ncbi:MAG: hypothetical protein FJ297_17630 [Planctomycetes bacterium]|nr:hypothetical protein [Planctomycetota bacterium]
MVDTDTVVQFAQSLLRAGAARGDITPPVGIYHRMWGAATHDRATGVHRPLTATALALAPLDPRRADETSVWLAVDHCLLWQSDMNGLLDAVSRDSGVPRSRIVIAFSHTHGAGLIGMERKDLPGGERIPEYLDRLASELGRLARDARDAMVDARIVYGRGHCDLAANRDYRDAERGAYVCGYNPSGPADDTLVVGRVTRADGSPIAVVVNYACHPTTLAWRNTVISPDYPGALREVVERETGSPCFFIQGASGDLGPRENYVCDTAVADRHGRRLGHSVVSVLEGLPPPATAYHYRGAVVSGATLGTWEYAPVAAERAEEFARWSLREVSARLPYRSDLPRIDDLEAESARWERAEQDASARNDAVGVRDARAMRERATRRITRAANLPPGDAYPFVAGVWRMGDAVWIALNGEHYQILQRRLREAFPSRTIVVATLANGSNVWYLPDAGSYGKGLYQEEASVVARGGLEILIAALENHLRADL